MKNYWLDRYRVGRRVRYVGMEEVLYLKTGVIVYRGYSSDYADVDFEFPGFVPYSKTYNVSTTDLEII